MPELKTYSSKHPRRLKVLLDGSIVFFSMFSFPFGNELFPLDISKAFLLAASFGVLGFFYALLYGRGKEKTVLILSVLFIALGMAGRFLLEFGEVSNTMNFTLLNIVSFLLVMPLYILLCYRVSQKNLLAH